jgi:hypothetical protein
VLWGFRDRDFLLSHGATCLVSAPTELLSGVVEATLPPATASVQTT